MWNQDKNVCWRGVVLLACAAVGLGCTVHGGRPWASDEPAYAMQLRVDENKPLLDGFSLPVSQDASGRFRVTPAQPLISDEVRLMWSKSVVGSVNADVPPASTLFMECRSRVGSSTTRPSKSDQRTEWTPWVRIAWVGRKPTSKQEPIEERLGSIEIDELKLKQDSDRLQVRLRLESDDPNAVATVSRLDVSIDEGYRAEVDRFHNELPAPIDIPVPFRSQKTSDAGLSGRLCSPTSVAMVLAYYGVDASVEEVAKKCYDPEYDIYGNWPRNIQAAYEFGVPGSLVRIESWWSACKILETGQPLIISIRAEKGDLRGAPYDSTEGHLIVLRGIDEFGNLIVNDPACGTAEDGKRVYRRSDLTKVWLQATNGTAYLLGTPELVQQARHRWNKEWSKAVEAAGSGR
jgi:hypothetical protein